MRAHATTMTQISEAFHLEGTASRKLSSGLLDLMRASLDGQSVHVNNLAAPATQVTAETWVAVQIVSRLAPQEETIAAWEAMGLKQPAASDFSVSGMVRLADLAQFAARADVAAIQYAPYVLEPGVVSGGELALGTTVANTKGYTGAGVKVGAISDSYNHLAGSPTRADAADDIASGDLPAAGVQVVQDMAGTGGTDEGRAMLQILHDLAPGATLMFATATGGPNNFANNIRALAAAGAKVIVDDVKYGNQLTFTDDVIRKAVDEVVAQGVHYFNSNGNNRDRGVMEINPVFDGTGVLDFDEGTAGTQLASFTAIQSGETAMRVTWSSRAPSVHGGTAETDLDVRILDANGNVVAQSFDDQTMGFDPFEYLTFSMQAGQTYRVEVTKYAGATPTHVQVNRVGGTEMNFAAAGVDEFAATYGHPFANGISVGAVDSFIAPLAGGSGDVESFSSYGRAFRTHDASGNALPTPVPVIGAEVAGVDGLANTFFGGGFGGVFYFYGTSAAAPSVAAVAALLLQQNPNITPAQMLHLLQSTADNAISYRDEAAFDPVSGAGIVNAPDALGAGLVGTGIVDQITGTPDAESIYGKDGNDSLTGLGGDDYLYGGLGADVHNGGAGFDYARYDDYTASGVTAALFAPGLNTAAAAGDTYIDIEGLILTVNADAGYGSNNADILQGIGGNDSLYGQGGNDSVYGGEGNDLLWGGLGADFQDGGNGFDYVRYDDATFPGLTAALFAPGLNTGAAAGDTYANVEGLILGFFDDKGYGSNNADYIYGINGNDQLYGQGGNDNVYGGSGNDLLWGGLGADLLDGGDGFDYARYDDATFPSLVASLSSPGINTGAAAGDTYFNLEGLILGYFDDTGYGSGDADYLYGINGNDTLYGLGGNDNLYGGAGNDTIVGGEGNDTLSGDVGSDAFRFDVAPNLAINADVILDFALGDKIHLENGVFTALVATGTLSSANFRSGAGITSAGDSNDFIIYNTTTGALYYDLDGTGAGAAVQFATLSNMFALNWSDMVVT